MNRKEDTYKTLTDEVRDRREQHSDNKHVKTIQGGVI